jgi:hypothetical protein
MPRAFWFLLVLLLALLAHAQPPATQPPGLRVILGHLYDLSAARAAGPHSAYSNYWISGQAAVAYPKCLLLHQSQKAVVLLDRGRVQYALSHADNETALEIHGLIQLMAKRPNGLDAGLWLTMSPLQQSLFTKKIRYQDALVLNYDADIRIGATVSFCAVSIGKASRYDATNLPAFDCGDAFTGVATNGWYQAMPKGMLPVGITNR